MWPKLIICSLVLCGSTLTGFLLVKFEYEARKQQVVAEKRVELDAASENLKEVILTPVSLMHSLQHSRETLDAVTLAMQDKPESLEGILLGLAQRHPGVQQARFIDLTGKERIRADRVADGVVLIPQAFLQDKSERYYVKSALKQDKDEVYLSALDLNVEFGQISSPQMPVIRYAVLVGDGNSQIHGLLVVNIDMSHWLRVISGISQFLLLDSTGAPIWYSDGFPVNLLRKDAARLKTAVMESQAVVGHVQFDTVMLLWQQIGLGTASLNDPHLNIDDFSKVAFLGYLPAETLSDISSSLMRRWGVPVGVVSVLLAAAVMMLLRVNERRQLAEIRAKQSERLASLARRVEDAEKEALMLIEANVNGFLTVDDKGRIHTANPAAESMFGYAPGELSGINVSQLVPQHASSKHQHQLQEYVLKDKRPRGMAGRMVFGLRKDGKHIPLEISLSPLPGMANRVSATVVDISERYHVQQRLRHIANHDVLTDLPNRMQLDERLRKAIARSDEAERTFALVFIDLDFFKTINDSLGHSAGDYLLKLVAKRMTSVTRDTDMVARLGGDEFVVLMEEIADYDCVAPMVDRLMSVFGELFEVEGRHIRVKASAGVSVYPQDGLTSDELLRNADTAMYHAKESGRDGISFYTEQLTQKARDWLTLENDLHKALECNELKLVYQPQINCKDGSLVGVEALIRWHHPIMGLISPSRFIPVAEATGQILDIGDWVIDEACRQASLWLQHGLDFGTLSINIAGPQIHRGELFNKISTALTEHDLPAHRLKLEVTEGFVMTQLHKGIEQLQKLNSLGVSLAIDDFGTGYSSLSYLKKLPIDTLKIDQSFIRELPEDKNDAAITQAIISMATHLNLDLIAEGVETKAQMEFLERHSCHVHQGYYFDCPMPALQLEQRYAGSRYANQG